MKSKVSKARKVRRVPQQGTPEYTRWRDRVASGMRQGKIRRQQAGLLTLIQVAVRYNLPVCFVRRKARLEELRVIKSGRRAYIWANEAERVFGEGTVS
jgi:hypothetical protein